ncbi:MAG: PKD domain-containing protein [Candidatus Bathyarchaeota archaeon]|nr:PKD domain-containing protein [Candidatus Bathyarchaeum sp.]
MKRTKQIALTIMLSSILSLGIFTYTVAAVENTPTIWVKIYRIQSVDDSGTVPQNNIHWKYKITVNDDKTSITNEYICDKTGDDIIVDRADSFNIEEQNVVITITVYKSNEIADVSGSPETSFECTYNIATNALGGDETVTDAEYYKTSGEHDGSEQPDENDTNLWFDIFDNYDSPLANAGADQTVYTSEEVNFEGTFSTASEGSSIVKFEWDFENDGVIDANGENVSYTYTQKGIKTCKLIVTDSIGATSEDTCRVNVLNRSPIANFTFSLTNPSIQDTVNITDTSFDSDGTINSWVWDFGDGTNSTLQNPTHTFSQKGEWQVTLTVTDNDEAETSVTHTLNVINLQPEASFECNISDAQTDTDIQFTDNSVDPENMSISWFWDFGDGNTSELQAPTHKYVTAGDYNVTLTVKDDENATSTYTMSISVTEQPKIDDSTSLWILGIVVIAIAAITLLGMLWWNRRRKGFTEMFTGSEDPAV